MIYHVIIGTEPAALPKIQSFLKSFLMPCHNGFTFAEVWYLTSIPLILMLTTVASLPNHETVDLRHF